MASRLALVVLILSSPVGAQEGDERPGATRAGESVFLDTDSAAVKKLESGRDLLRAEQWGEAIGLLRQIAEQHGDKLVSISRGRYVNVQTYCNMLQARLPPAGLKIYRERVDPQARQWYEAATRDRLEEPLLRIVQQAFASSFGDLALLQLGDRAWERGDLSLARSYWQKLLPAAAAPKDQTAFDASRGSGPVFPDSRFQPALVRARLVLATLLQGNLSRGRLELAEFTTLHSKASGKFAGKDGRLVETLQGVLREVESSKSRRESSEYTTFAANSQRNKILPQAVDVGAVQWDKSLKETVFPAEAGRRGGRDLRELFGPAREPSVGVRPGYFPVLYKNIVLLCDDVSVFAWNLETGKPAWPGTDASSAAIYTLPLERRRQTAVTRQIAGLPWYTLTVDRGRAYAKLGSIALGQGNAQRTQSLGSFLVALDLEEGEGKLLWMADASQIEEGVAGGEDAAREVDRDGGGTWSFDGSPVAAGDRIYVGLRRWQPRPQVNVACLDATTGRLLWNRKVCTGLEILAGEVHEVGHQVLTLADGRLYYTTNLGAVAALNARDGQLRWVATYAHTDVDKVEQFTARQKFGPNPCLFHDGVIIAAPTDSDSLLAYDAETGRQLWERNLPNRSLRALLGVARGKLIVSGNDLFALSIDNGEILWRHDGEDPEHGGYGRGVVAGDLVYWPKREEILMADLDSGKPRRRVSLTEPVRYGSGNLVATDGYLLIAEPNRLVCRCEYGRLIKQYEDEIAQRPRAALPHYLLATAQEASSLPESALQNYRRARDLAGPDEQRDSQPLAELSTRRLFALLDSEGKKLLEAGVANRAAAYFAEAAVLPVETGQRLQAHLQWAKALEKNGQHRESAAVLQRLLDMPVLAAERFSSQDRKSVRQWTAARWATHEIQRLIASHGRTVYASQDSAAQELFQQATRQGDWSALRRSLERYSQAASAGEYWLVFARNARKVGNFAAAASAYQTVADSPAASSEQRRDALVELARQAESRRFYNSAAMWWRRLKQTFPESQIRLDPSASPAEVRRVVAERLRRPEFQSEQSPDRGDHELSRAWERPLPEGARCLVPEGNPPGIDWTSVLMVNAGVTCLDARSGQVRWKLSTDDRPGWALFANDVLVLGSPTGLIGLEPDSGQVAWRHVWDSGSQIRPLLRQSSARLTGRNRVVGRSSWSGRRHGVSVRTVSLARNEQTTYDAGVSCDYRWDGTRILCLRGDRSLECINPLDGESEWSFQPETGILQSKWCNSLGRVILQTVGPDRTLVVNSGSGSLITDVPGLDQPWQADPVPLENGRVACVSGPMRLQMIDPATGDVNWTYEGALSQSHAVPTWLVRNSMLLLIKDGSILARVNPETGDDLWNTRFANVPATDISRSLLCAGTRAWYAADGSLRCFNLETGLIEWEQYLGFSNDLWQILDLGTALGIIPRNGKSGAGMLLCEKESGQFLQRIPLAGMGTRIDARTSAAALLLIGEHKLVRLK